MRLQFHTRTTRYEDPQAIAILLIDNVVKYLGLSFESNVLNIAWKFIAEQPESLQNFSKRVLNDNENKFPFQAQC